jgi:UDPglucose 6-dehydrogenase
LSPVRITVVGTGYVGISNAVLLAQHNQVVALDIDARKVVLLNAGKSPIADPEIEDFLANKPLNLIATTDREAAFDGAHFVIVATPTDYDPDNNFFQHDDGRVRDRRRAEACAAGADRHQVDDPGGFHRANAY